MAPRVGSQLPWPPGKTSGIGTERGCVEDQPQRVGSSKASRACSVLRLVEDDTAALRSNSAGRGQGEGSCQFQRVRISAQIANPSSFLLPGGNWIHYKPVCVADSKSCALDSAEVVARRRGGTSLAVGPAPTVHRRGVAVASAVALR